MVKVTKAIRNCTFLRNRFTRAEGTANATFLSVNANGSSGQSVFVNNVLDALGSGERYFINGGGNGIGGLQTPLSLCLVNNTIKGGTTISSLTSSGTSCLMNSLIVGNKAEGYGTDCVASTLRRTGVAYLLWSTVYNNEFPIEFYGNQNKNNHQVYANSSIIWRDASLSEYTVSASLLMSKGQIVIRHVCMSGVKEDDECIGATGTGANDTIGLFTDDPKFASSLQKDESGRVYAVLSRQSPYKRSGYFRSAVWMIQRRMRQQVPSRLTVMKAAGVKSRITSIVTRALRPKPRSRRKTSLVPHARRARSCWAPCSSWHRRV